MNPCPRLTPKYLSGQISTNEHATPKALTFGKQGVSSYRVLPTVIWGQAKGGERGAWPQARPGSPDRAPPSGPAPGLSPSCLSLLRAWIFPVPPTGPRPPCALVLGLTEARAPSPPRGPWGPSRSWAGHARPPSIGPAGRHQPLPCARGPRPSTTGAVTGARRALSPSLARVFRP